MSLSDCECGDNIDLDQMDLEFDGCTVFWTVICLRCEVTDRFMADITNQRYYQRVSECLE